MSSGITLKYWSGRGLMEVPRQMLAIAGLFPGVSVVVLKPLFCEPGLTPPPPHLQAGYTDVRVSGAPPSGPELDANLGRLPCLEVGGVTIGQSAAINFYVAQHTGLLGSSPAEAAQIIAFTEHLRELNQAFRALVPYGTEPTEAAMAAFFDDSSAADFTGPADGAKRAARNMKWFMGRLERLVGEGFCVGGKTSLADVMLFQFFADSLTPEESATGDLPAHRREPWSSKARTDAALAAHPRVAACVAGVAAHPNIKQWLATRGKQGF